MSVPDVEVVHAFIRDFFNAHDPAAGRYCSADYIFQAGSLGSRKRWAPSKVAI